MSEKDFDLRFSFPAVDDPASVEVGVIILGLDEERLLAGLGVAPLVPDPTMATLVVDQIRHRIPVRDTTESLSMAAAVTSGVRRWRSARPALAEAAERLGLPAISAAVRQAWARAEQVVAAAELGDVEAAGRAYLAACWVLQSEVDRYVEAHHAVPEVAPG